MLLGVPAACRESFHVFTFRTCIMIQPAGRQTNCQSKARSSLEAFVWNPYDCGRTKLRENVLEVCISYPAGNDHICHVMSSTLTEPQSRENVLACFLWKQCSPSHYTAHARTMKFSARKRNWELTDHKCAGGRRAGQRLCAASARDLATPSQYFSLLATSQHALTQFLSVST